MGIVKKDFNDRVSYSPFQLSVLSILDEYNYTIADTRYIEELKQIVVTIQGLVLFITPEDISISFEITTTPDVVATTILILTEKIKSKNINVTDSFIITQDVKGNKIAVFGSDAQSVYETDLARKAYKNDYIGVLMSPNVKFYNC
jgi:hypothetical protein